MHRLLHKACDVGGWGPILRRAHVGAVGVRRDGVMVFAFNSPTHNQTPSAHAEKKLLRKLDKGSIVYVGRRLRSDGSVAMAKPCPRCEAALRNKGVSKVYYTVAPGEWGCLEF